ncbi:MAG TPA: nicotinamide riboside transporter PnuC [Kofleriaceae bacterium]|nr:nicotinamide riboside transporter PnuC [Kofleriaceae bacterium]
MSRLELAANALGALSILLAGRNSAHTWWTGILGCALFGLVFFEVRLYADATLQGFFIATSAAGWWAWLRGASGAELPVRATPPRLLAAMAAAAVLVALAYGWVLHRFTDAWQPFVDSLVLTGSVLAQLLLMARRVETWPCWLLVNTLSVPLFWSRGLHLTAALYACYWVNALVSMVHWRRLARAAS